MNEVSDEVAPSGSSVAKAVDHGRRQVRYRLRNRRIVGAARRGSDRWRCADCNRADDAALLPGVPRMVDALQHDTVTRDERMYAVVEDQLHGSLDDDIEVQRVGVVHPVLATWLELPQRPTAQARCHAEVHQLAVTRWTRRGRGLGCGEHPEPRKTRGNLGELGLFIPKGTGSPVSANTRHNYAHTPNVRR